MKRTLTITSAIAALTLPLAAMAEGAPPALTAEEMAVSVNFNNLAGSIGALVQASMKERQENEVLKSQLSDALAKCADLCKPKPETK